MSIRSITDEFVSNATPATMNHLISVFRESAVPDADIAYLAIRLAESGKRLTGFEQTQIVADVPSTGGPSSLSTLLCPLQLVSLGAVVPKLGVPGRPAGGIDVLACIPGYQVSLGLSGIRRSLRVGGYVHFLAGVEFAPLDALLFQHRLKVQATDVPPLVIASLLSKKIAVGVRKLTLDVRVARHTNFGSTWEEARENSKAFTRIAHLVSIDAKCYLTDASLPYQRFIGRGECLMAMDAIFREIPDPGLKRHLGLCSRISAACMGRDVHAGTDELQRIFADNLREQGANMESFAQKVQEIKTHPKITLTAESNGYLTVNMEGIRRVLVACQAAAKSRTDPFPDPCGIVLAAGSGTFIQKGEPLAQVRSVTQVEALAHELSPYIETLPGPSTPRRDPELVT